MIFDDEFIMNDRCLFWKIGYKWLLSRLCMIVLSNQMYVHEIINYYNNIMIIKLGA